MKKFWILFMIVLGFVCVSVFSISFGKEENQEPEQSQTQSQTPASSRKGDC